MKLNTLEIGATGNGTSPFVVNRIRGFPGTKKLHYCRPNSCHGDGTHNNQYFTVHAYLVAGFLLPRGLVYYLFLLYILRFYNCGLTDNFEVCSNPSDIYTLQAVCCTY